jgi:hypothetical protein
MNVCIDSRIGGGLIPTRDLLINIVEIKLSEPANMHPIDKDLRSTRCNFMCTRVLWGPSDGGEETQNNVNYKIRW